MQAAQQAADEALKQTRLCSDYERGREAAGNAFILLHEAAKAASAI
jgi:hypothetical protein